MNKTLIIVLLSILLAGAIFVMFYTGSNHSADVGKMVRIQYEKDSLMRRFKYIQFVYEQKEKQLTSLEANLLTEKSKAKRLEQKLSELLKRERYEQIENKRVFQYNDFQLDSAFRRMYLRADSSIYSSNSKAGSF